MYSKSLITAFVNIRLFWLVICSDADTDNDWSLAQCVGLLSEEYPAWQADINDSKWAQKIF